MKFVDKGDYYLGLDEQRSEEWKFSRKNRINASGFGDIIKAMTNSGRQFKTLDEIIENIMGKEYKFSEEAMRNINHGIEYEPIARAWAEKQLAIELKCQIKIEESGLMIPKWDLGLGASLDGEVYYRHSDDEEWKRSEINVEIKCPQKMYYNLYYRKNDFSHIYESHYYQMLGGMAISNKKYCYYVVYTDDEIITEFVPFNKEKWEYIYNILKEFRKKYLKNIFPEFTVSN